MRKVSLFFGAAVCWFNACELDDKTPTIESAPEQVDKSECGDITFAGKCKGNVLKYCQDEKLEKIDCSLISATCGWDDTYGYNTCLLPVTAIPQEESSDDCPDLGVTKCIEDSEDKIQECVKKDGVLKWDTYSCDDGNNCTDDLCFKDVCQFKFKCLKGTYCSKGVCKPICTPDCLNRNCGPDGCGGSCGGCADGYECNLSVGHCGYLCENGMWCADNEGCCKNSCMPKGSTCCEIEDKPDLAVWCGAEYPVCVSVPKECEANNDTKCCHADYSRPCPDDPCNKCCE